MQLVLPFLLLWKNAVYACKKMFFAKTSDSLPWFFVPPVARNESLAQVGGGLAQVASRLGQDGNDLPEKSAP